MKSPTSVKIAVPLLLGFTTGGAALSKPEAIDSIIGVLSQASQSQFAQAGFFFMLAAFIHSGRMKKEIRFNFQGLSDSIDRVSVALKEDLRRHGERLDAFNAQVLGQGEILDKVVSRVEYLEATNNKQKTKGE